MQKFSGTGYPLSPGEPRTARRGPLTCDEGRLRGRLLQEDHMLQEGAWGCPRVPLQRCCAQVGGEVGTREEGDALLQGGEGQSLGLLLAGRPLDRQTQPGARVRGLGGGAALHHRLIDPGGAHLPWRGRWRAAPV